MLDLIFWLEDNLVVAAAAVVGLFVLVTVVLMARRKSRQPLSVKSDFSQSSDGDRLSQGSATGNLGAGPVQDGPEFHPADNHEHARRLIQSIQGDPPRKKFSAMYMVGLAIVAVTMLILPLIYLAIISSAAYGMYWYATEKYHLLSTIPGVRTRILVYFGPLLVGTIVVFFLFKPLFARRAKQVQPIAITEQEQPVLFAFIQELCLTLKAPRPRRVLLDNQVNASASFRNGLWSLIRPGDLTLTIGLPLVAGLSIQSFAGVLAHEFGHFTQGMAMRLNYIIGYINRWFARLVYEDDSWDVTMNEMSESSGVFGVIFLLARLAIKISKGILWCLMQFGHMISCFLMRQQEYDADRYEAYIAGSNHFDHTFSEMISMSVASDFAISKLDEGLKKMMLPDDFVGVCIANRYMLRPEAVEEFYADQKDQKGRLFDTHPGIGQRVSAVEALGEPGIFHPPAVSALTLFRHREELCRKVTLNFYQQSLGRLADNRITVPLMQFLEKMGYKVAAEDAPAETA